MALAQVGIFGPVTAHTRAGDPALEHRLPPHSQFANAEFLVLVKSVRSGDGARFLYPDTSDNLQSVTMWNATIDKFAEQNGSSWGSPRERREAYAMAREASVEGSRCMT